MKTEIARLKTEINQIKASLGDFQYLAVDPRLEFDMPVFEVSKAERHYGSPKLKYTVNVKQYAAEFPVSTYNVYATVEVTNEQSAKVHNFQITFLMVNGIASTSDVKTLYGMDEYKGNLQSLKGAVVAYYWFPKRGLKPFQTA